MDFVSRLLSFIPDSKLEEFAITTSVNRYAKKLQGELLFKLLFYCLLTEKDTSLRGMQSALESSLFAAISQSSTTSISISSISEKLSSIAPQYFASIFNYAVERYKNESSLTKQTITRFDSTIIALSSKILKVGYQLRGGDAEKYKMLKFTIGYSDVPDCICFYTEQKYTSENAALTEAILTSETLDKENVIVFDRGITGRVNYDRLTDNNISFVSRINPNARHTTIKRNALKRKIVTDTLIIDSDCWVYLYSAQDKKSKHPIRVIHATKKENEEKISFITNIEKINVKEITEIYKSRWAIEIFFKFLKQHLNFSHLLNRSENGIKVIMYITMIVAILLEQYKRDQSLKGYKIPKKKFAQDLERDIIYNIVVLCGGDKKKAKIMLYGSSP